MFKLKQRVFSKIMVGFNRIRVLSCSSGYLCIDLNLVTDRYVHQVMNTNSFSKHVILVQTSQFFYLASKQKTLQQYQLKKECRFSRGKREIMFYCVLNICTQFISLNYTVCVSVHLLQCRVVVLTGADGLAARVRPPTLIYHMQTF